MKILPPKCFEMAHDKLGEPAKAKVAETLTLLIPPRITFCEKPWKPQAGKRPGRGRKNVAGGQRSAAPGQRITNRSASRRDARNSQFAADMANFQGSAYDSVA